jgi:hypothetical protein
MSAPQLFRTVRNDAPFPGDARDALHPAEPGPPCTKLAHLAPGPPAPAGGWPAGRAFSGMSAAQLALDVPSHSDAALYISLVILHTKYT